MVTNVNKNFRFQVTLFEKRQFMSELLIHKSSLQLIVGVLRTGKL